MCLVISRLTPSSGQVSSDRDISPWRPCPFFCHSRCAMATDALTGWPDWRYGCAASPPRWRNSQSAGVISVHCELLALEQSASAHLSKNGRASMRYNSSLIFFWRCDTTCMPKQRDHSMAQYQYQPVCASSPRLEASLSHPRRVHVRSCLPGWRRRLLLLHGCMACIADVRAARGLVWCHSTRIYEGAYKTRIQ